MPIDVLHVLVFVLFCFYISLKFKALKHLRITRVVIQLEIPIANVLVHVHVCGEVHFKINNKRKDFIKLDVNLSREQI